MRSFFINNKPESTIPHSSSIASNLNKDHIKSIKGIFAKLWKIDINSIDLHAMFNK